MVWVVQVVTHERLQQDKEDPRIPNAKPKIDNEIPHVMRIRPIHIDFGRKSGSEKGSQPPKLEKVVLKRKKIGKILISDDFLLKFTS